MNWLTHWFSKFSIKTTIKYSPKQNSRRHSQLSRWKIHKLVKRRIKCFHSLSSTKSVLMDSLLNLLILNNLHWDTKRCFRSSIKQLVPWCKLRIYSLNCFSLRSKITLAWSFVKYIQMCWLRPRMLDKKQSNNIYSKQLQNMNFNSSTKMVIQ